MLKRIQWASLCLVMLFALSACASKQKLKVGVKATGEVVEAEGLAAVVPDLIGTKKAALEDARKNAVEKVVGVLISAQTMVDKAVTIEQNILAKTDGYVKDYEVIREGVESDGIYHTHIRAFVSFQQIKRDLSAANLLAAPSLENPRVAILIQEQVEGSDHSLNDCSNALSQSLIDQGYTIVDSSLLQKQVQQESLVDVFERSSEAELVKAGEKLDAEILIVGRAKTQVLKSDVLGADMVSYRATLSAKAIKIQSAQVLAAVNTQASGLDAVAYVAAQKSLTALGESAAQEMGKKVAAELMRQSSVMIDLRRVSDVSALSTFIEKLKMVQGVGAVYVRSYADTNAQLQLKTKELTVSNLVLKLKSLVPNIKVLRQTYETLELEL